MARLPTNVSLFGQYLLGDQSPITEKDFTPEELQVIVNQIEAQDRANAEAEQRVKGNAERTLKRLKEPSSRVDDRIGINTVSGVGLSQVLNEKTNKLEDVYKTQDEYNKEVQKQINKYQNKIDSFDRTRNKTSVTGYRDIRTDPAGEGLVNAITNTFSSPAYNIETSLGHYNAYKNEDGTVTVKDTYDFYGYGYDKGSTVSLKDFLKALPEAVTKPEAFGTLLSRFALPNRQREVNINLPSNKDEKAKTAKTFKEAL